MNIELCIEQFKEQMDILSFSEEECISMLKLMDDAYDNDISIMETNDWNDSLYDSLRSQVYAEYKNNDYFATIGSDVRTGKQTLPYKMGSLNESYTQEDLDKWVENNGLADEIIVISAKYDGNSGEAIFTHTFTQSFSRGNGFEGADTTRHLKTIIQKYDINLSKLKKLLPPNDHIALRGEVIWANSQFDNFSHLDYKHPRNAVAGLMNKEKTSEDILKSISFIPFNIDSCGAEIDKLDQLNILEDCGFHPVLRKHCLGKELKVEFLTDTILAFRDQLDYKIDGIVLEVNNNKLRQRIQPDNKSANPEYATKFKLDMLPVTAVVDHVEWNISKCGYYKPTIIYKPVEIDGITCTRATGYNARYIVTNNIGPGTVIKIVRRGDVVPNCVGIIKPTIAQLPDVDMSTVFWTVNDKNEQVDLVSTKPTTESKILQMVYCAEKLKIQLLGEGNIRQLHENLGIIDTHELLKLSHDDLSNVLGSNGDKIFDSMMESLSEIDECVLAAASGIFGRGIGERKLKNILQQTKCRIQDLTHIKMLSVSGVGEKTINQIIDCLDEYTAWLNQLDGYANIIPTVSSEVKKYDGLNVVFTGFRNDDLQWYLERHGASVKSTVTKNTNIVLTPDPSANSSKLKKARELINSGLDIKLMSVEDFKTLYMHKDN